MRHSKLPPQYKSNWVAMYSTGYIELSAQRVTDKKTLYIDVELSMDTAREIQKSLNLADEKQMNIGHAYWHIHNNHPVPCSMCDMQE